MNINISGTANFEKPVNVIWDGLHDVAVLKNAIPGCQAIEFKEGGEYDVTLKLGVAAVKGEYIGKVKLEDIEILRHYFLTAEGSGTPGHVNAKMDCRLTPLDNNSCQLDWECKAEVGGMIASVGNRVLSGIAKYMAGKFFKDIEKQLSHIGDAFL